MFNKVLVWLRDMLGLSFPAILSMAISLTGEEGDKDKDSYLPPLLAATEHLGMARANFEMRRYSEAEVHLRRADELMRDLTTHTPSFERLSARKAALWEEVSRHLPPQENRK